jgi:hypothetical protein
MLGMMMGTENYQKTFFPVIVIPVKFRDSRKAIM